MKSFLVHLLDKLVILFLYLNVLVPTVAPYGIPLNKATFALIVGVYVAIVGLGAEKVRRRTLFYVTLSLGGMAVLALVSWLQGNEPALILGLAAVVLIVLIVPPLTLLFHRSGTERYVGHLVRAIVILAGSFLVLVILTGPLGQRQIAAFVEDSGTTFSDTLRFAFFPGGVRITTTNQGFLPAGLVLVYMRFLHWGRWRDLVGSVVVGIAIHYCYTFSLWISALLGLALCLGLARGKTLRRRSAPAQRTVMPPLKISSERWRKFVTVFAGAIVMAVTVVRLPEFILESKSESINFKHQQLREALGTFYSSPWAGKGLGYVYRDDEFIHVSSAASTLLENSYAVILASTGLLGIAVFSFVYLYYPFMWLRSSKSRMTLALLICHCTVLVEAWGNPFLWSGGLGLLFACFLGACLEHGSAQKAPHFVPAVEVQSP